MSFDADRNAEKLAVRPCAAVEATASFVTTRDTWDASIGSKRNDAEWSP